MQKHKLVHFFSKLPTLPFVYFSDVRRSKGQQAMTKTVFGYPMSLTFINLFRLKIKSMAGNDLEILETRDGFTISGARLLISEQQVNFYAENGIIHMIEDLIYPFTMNEPFKKKKLERYCSYIKLSLFVSNVVIYKMQAFGAH